MSDVAFPALTAAQKIAKAVGWDVGVNAALTSLGLNVWPLNAMIEVITDRIWFYGRLGMDLAAINFVNAAHEKAVNDEYARLHILANGYGIDSPQFKEARKNAQKTLAKFSRYGATL